MLPSLQNLLQRTGCVAEDRRANELEVDLPGAPSADQARREINVYLATWQAKNPGVEAYIVENDETG